MLYLEQASPDPALAIGRASNRIVAAVDPAVLDPFDKAGLVYKHAEKADSVLVRFAHQGEKAKFKFDARDLIWDHEVVDRSPAYKLFAIAKPGPYRLQFYMSSGPCESAKLPLTIATDKSTK